MAAALMGLLSTAIGIVVFMEAFATSALSATFIAGALLASAAAQSGFAFLSKRAGNFVPKLLIAGCYAAAGAALSAAPGATQAIVGAMLMLETVFEAVIVTEMPDVAGRKWYLFSAVSSLILGHVVFSDHSAWLIGAAIGLAVACNGLSRIVVSAMDGDAGKLVRARLHVVEVFAACLLLGAVSLPAAADPLADLHKTLDRFPAKAPFAARATVKTNAVADDDTGRAGTASFDVESGPAGFTIRTSPSVLDAAQREAAQKKRDPNVATPTRTAMVALTIFDIMDALDAASLLLDDLSSATVLEETGGAWEGKPATVVRVKVKPSLATKSRYVGEPVIELTIWIGSDGIPVAARRISTFQAGALFVKAGNVRTERWTFAVAGDRLYATRNEQEDNASAVGKKMTRSHTVTYKVR